jgi:hypothetical protein
MTDGGFPVKLYLYDISHGMARSMSQSLLGKYIEGIWHSGVVVYGREYYWGGIIQVGAPGTSPYGTPQKIIDLGVTHIPRDVFEDFVGDVKHNYTVQTYSLLNYNCNNFSNEVSNFLLGTDIPTEVKDLPSQVLSTPFGQMIRPFIEQMESQAKQYVMPDSYAPDTSYMLPNRPVPVTPTAPVNASTQLPDMSHLGVKEPSVTFDHDRLTQNFVWIRKNEQPLLAAVLPATTIDRLVALPSNAENKDQLEELRVQLKELDATKSCKLTQPTVSFLMTRLENLQDDRDLFINVLRVLVTDEKFNRSLVTRRADLLRGIFSGFLAKTAEKKVRVMTLLLCSNLFVTAQGREFMLHKETTDIVFDHLIDCLTTSGHELPGVGALFNYCMYFPKTANFEDLIIQAVSALIEVLRNPPSQTTKEAEFALRALRSLGHCLLNNPTAAELALGLDIHSLLDSFNTFPDNRIKQVAAEVKQLCHC